METMHNLAFPVTLALFLVACGPSDSSGPSGPPSSSGFRVVEVGLSSGFCAGICDNRMTVDHGALELTQYLQMPGHEIAAVMHGNVTPQAQTALAAAEASLTAGVTYGCPGCADEPVCAISVIDELGVSSTHKYNCHYSGATVPAAVQPVHDLLIPALDALSLCQATAAEVPVDPCPWQ
jgi:hypothetical protein